MRRSWRQALNELNYELRPKTLVRDLRALTPWLGDDDLLAAHSGVRAQALTPDGSFVDDFWFDRAPRMLHVRNAPSPAATSSLAIARYVVAEIESELRPRQPGLVPGGDQRR
jgi:L-2-hydroxyglutarate oxidase